MFFSGNGCKNALIDEAVRPIRRASHRRKTVRGGQNNADKLQGRQILRKRQKTATGNEENASFIRKRHYIPNGFKGIDNGSYGNDRNGATGECDVLECTVMQPTVSSLALRGAHGDFFVPAFLGNTIAFFGEVWYSVYIKFFSADEYEKIDTGETGF